MGNEAAIEATTDNTATVHPTATWPRWAQVFNFSMAVFVAACGFAGFALWVNRGVDPADALVWLGMAIAGLCWAVTQAMNFSGFGKIAEASSEGDAPVAAA